VATFSVSGLPTQALWSWKGVTQFAQLSVPRAVKPMVEEGGTTWFSATVGMLNWTAFAPRAAVLIRFWHPGSAEVTLTKEIVVTLTGLVPAFVPLNVTVELPPGTRAGVGAMWTDIETGAVPGVPPVVVPDPVPVPVRVNPA
jgi:hypothetical protein